MNDKLEIEKQHECVEGAGARAKLFQVETDKVITIAGDIFRSWVGYQLRDHGKTPEDIGTPEVQKQVRESIRIAKAYREETTKYVVSTADKFKIKSKSGIEIVAPKDHYLTKKALDNYKGV